MITKETRLASNMKVDRRLRYSQILTALENVYPKGMTVREIMENFKIKERNYIAPRCTELKEKGLIEEIGKAYDYITNRNITIYRIVKE